VEVNFGLILYVRLGDERPVPSIRLEHFVIGDELGA
jgi:hypothetical protein